MSEQPAAPVENDLPLEPLPPGVIPDSFAKSADPSSPPPMRMMAARAMAPIPPKALVPIIYQLMMDPDPKIVQAATKSFRGLDDKLLAPIVGDANVPGQILDAICHVLVARPEVNGGGPLFASIEKLLLNKSTPDSGFVWVAGHATDEKIFNLVVENQERLLRTLDIVRALSKNKTCLRSELDRAIDFLVREGQFLEDVPEFEDSFMRLGKAEMLEAMKKVKVGRDALTAKQQAQMDARGLTPDQVVFGDDAEASDEMVDAIADGKPEVMGGGNLASYPLPVQIKLAMTGSHQHAIEALTSPNRMVAVAGISNPKVKENDVIKISRSRSMHEDVIRRICANGDWTKSYAVKLNLVQNPKTPFQLVSRWLPLLRQSDLKLLSKSKQIPSQVQIQAKRMIESRGPG
jgi:hypothetical protein